MNGHKYRPKESVNSQPTSFSMSAIKKRK